MINIADMTVYNIELKALEECLAKSLVRAGYLSYKQGKPEGENLPVETWMNGSPC